MRQGFRAAAIGLTLGAASLSSHAAAQTAPAIQLRGQLTQADASRIIATVKEGQEKLRRGEQVYFQLLSGAPASYAQTLISPRDAFLALSFDAPFSLENRSTGNQNWQPYRFELAARQSLVWQVDVVLGFNNQLERVEILARPPHPF